LNRRLFNHVEHVGHVEKQIRNQNDEIRNRWIGELFGKFEFGFCFGFLTSNFDFRFFGLYALCSMLYART